MQFPVFETIVPLFQEHIFPQTSAPPLLLSCIFNRASEETPQDSNFSAT